jgi:NitT/TauT family transport system substrate-binding protein
MTRHSPRTNVKVLMAVLLAGLGVTSAAAQTAAPLPEIRVAISTSDQGTALLYADSAGLFRKAGLNVTITKMRSGAEIVAGIVGGSLDIGNSSVVTVIEGHARGVPFQMIAPTTYYSADKRDSGLIVPVASPIKEPRDLIGKNVGVVSLQDIFTLSLLVWLTQHGVDPQAVHFVEMPPPAAAAAMEQGRLDAAVVFQPVMSQDVGSQKFRILGYPLDAMGKVSEVSAFVAMPDWVAAHRDIVDRFNRALYNASIYVSKHERETGPILATWAGVDPEVVATMTRPGRSLYLVPEQLQNFVDEAAKFKLIDKPFPVAELISPAALKPPRGGSKP